MVFSTDRYKYLTGFTLIELLIVLGITAILTTIVSVNFARLRSSQELQTATRSVVSKIREVQNFVLSGESRPEGLPRAYEITFVQNGQNYLIRYDVDGNLFTLETINLTQNMKIDRISVGGSPRTQTTVRFTSPYGQIFVDGIANQILEIALVYSTTGQTHSVIIDGISGRITIQ